VVQLHHAIWNKIAELKKSFPHSVDYVDHLYDPTNFVDQSIHEVIVTIFVAIALVVGVVYIFLQSWRATIIPVVAIPISLVGTFSILAAAGASINNLSLFGLVLAVGIVVDDAIVVVENVGPIAHEVNEQGREKVTHHDLVAKVWGLHFATKQAQRVAQR
jgi:multidrug efflux pump subunit AcrB